MVAALLLRGEGTRIGVQGNIQTTFLTAFFSGQAKDDEDLHVGNFVWRANHIIPFV